MQGVHPLKFVLKDQWTNKLSKNLNQNDQIGQLRLHIKKHSILKISLFLFFRQKKNVIPTILKKPTLIIQKKKSYEFQSSNSLIERNATKQRVELNCKLKNYNRVLI